MAYHVRTYDNDCLALGRATHHAQTDLNKKSGAMPQTFASFNIDAQAFRKTKNENHPTQEIGDTS